MSIDFLKADCQGVSTNKLFGLCDDPHPAKNAAYIDEKDGSKWIAVVVNDDQYTVTFTAVDHCIAINRPDGKMASRCDGFLTYNSTVVFVELKEQDILGPGWVKDAEIQLRTTISHFEKNEHAEKFVNKRAYIANKMHPKFKESQVRRMDQFFTDTGYALRIESRITL